MANIEKKKYADLEYNSKLIIRTIDVGLDGGPFPIVVNNIDPTVDEVCDAMKYVIDTGWTNGKLYARRVEYTNQFKEYETGLFITHDEIDFKNIELNGFYYVSKDFPTIIATDYTFEAHVSYNGFVDYEHDGDIHIKLEDGSIITKSEWDEIQNKKTRS